MILIILIVLIFYKINFYFTILNKLIYANKVASIKIYCFTKISLKTINKNFILSKWFSDFLKEKRIKMANTKSSITQ